MNVVASSGSLNYLQYLALKSGEEKLYVTQSCLDNLTANTNFKTRAQNEIDELIRKAVIVVVEQPPSETQVEQRKEIESGLQSHREQRRALIRQRSVRRSGQQTRRPPNGCDNRPSVEDELGAEDLEFNRAVDDILIVRHVAQLCRNSIDNVALLSSDVPVILRDASGCNEIRRARGYRTQYGIKLVTKGELHNLWQRVPPHFTALRRCDRLDVLLVVAQVLFFLILFPGLIIGLTQYFGDTLTAAFKASLLRVQATAISLYGFIFLLVLGVGIYAIRGHCRFWYGAFEYAFGFFVAYFAWPTPEQSLELNAWLAFGAGLYVMVRGLDNIGKAIKDEDWVRWWSRFFGPDYK